MGCIGADRLLATLEGTLRLDEIRVIEEHVDSCSGCRGTLSTLSESWSRSAAPEPPAISSTGSLPTAGRRYLLLEPIGQGAMGQVFRAQDRLTGKTVALKRLALGTALAAERWTLSRTRSGWGTGARVGVARGKRLALAREFRTLAGLRHPNIISVLDYGFDAQHDPFFTMELLSDAHPLLPFALREPPEVRLSLLLEVVRALVYLHRRGILHRVLSGRNCAVLSHRWK